MKTSVKIIALLVIASMLTTSCYRQTSIVGSGAKGTVEVKKKNHYLIGGLIPLREADTHKMADGATDYTIHTKHSFGDAIIRILTIDIYTPTTTKVRK
jgi:hypothetical protein